MAKQRSPGYPGMDLIEAIALAEKLYNIVRTSITTREDAAKDLGYAGLTGASAKALADLVHYGLLERSGKGGIRLTQRTVNILWGEPEEKRQAISEAAVYPTLFSDLQEQFPEVMPSENQLKGFLHRRGFADVAIPYVMKSYTGTRRLAEEETESKSHGIPPGQGAETAAPTETKVNDMTDATTLKRHKPTLAPLQPDSGGAGAINQVTMNIQGDKVFLSGLLDMKGLDALEKKIAALRTLLDINHETVDAGAGNAEQENEV